MNTPTPEQTAQWREEAQKVWNEQGRAHWVNMAGFNNYAAGYLRRCQETEQAIKDAKKQALEEVYNLCEAVEIDTWNTSGKRAVARCMNEIKGLLK